MATATNLVTPGRWLRNIKNGTIYGWCELLDANPATEEVSEEVAFPDKFLPEAQKGRKSAVNLDEGEDVVVEAKANTDKPKTRARVALEADASKGLGKA